MSAPDVAMYYAAAQLRITANWIDMACDKHWRWMEHTIVRRPLWDLLWLPKSDRPPNAYLCTPSGTTLRVWDSYVTKAGLVHYPSP